MGTGALCLGLPTQSAHLAAGASGVSVEDVGVLEKCRGLVPGRQLRRSIERPVDGQVGVVPANAAFGRWVVVLSGFVQNLGELTQHQETVGEALGNPQLAIVLRRKTHGYPLAEMWRAAPHINSHIKDFPGTDPNQFVLGILKLVMQPAQHAFLRARMVVLNELSAQASGFLENLRIETFVEKTTIVTENLGLDDQNTGQVGGHNIHGFLQRWALMVAILAQSACKGECRVLFSSKLTDPAACQPAEGGLRIAPSSGDIGA